LKIVKLPYTDPKSTKLSSAVEIDVKNVEKVVLNKDFVSVHASDNQKIVIDLKTMKFETFNNLVLTRVLIFLG
jgi:hypothetical protein